MKELIKKLIDPKWEIPAVVFGGFLISRLLLYGVFRIWQFSNDVSVSLFSRINGFDAGWYMSIVGHGYDLAPYAHEAGDAANWAFFPMLPILIRYISMLFQAPVNVTGSVVNSVFFCTGLIVAGNYILKTRQSRNQALFFVLAYLFGPYSFYFSIFYTEALFFLLVMLFFWFMKEKKYLLMGVVGAMASATRNLGVMLVFAVLTHYTVEFFHTPAKKTFASYWIKALTDYRLVLGTMLIPLGLFLYMSYLGNLIGDPLAFVHIQLAWGDEGGPVREVIGAFLGHTSRWRIYFAMTGVAGLAGGYYLARTKQWEEAVMGLLFIFLPFSVRTSSMPRYIVGSVIPVLGWNDMAFKCSPKGRKFLWIVFMLIELFLFWQWLDWEPYLM